MNSIRFINLFLKDIEHNFLSDIREIPFHICHQFRIVLLHQVDQFMNIASIFADGVQFFLGDPHELYESYFAVQRVLCRGCCVIDGDQGSDL